MGGSSHHVSGRQWQLTESLSCSETTQVKCRTDFFDLAQLVCASVAALQHFSLQVLASPICLTCWSAICLELASMLNAAFDGHSPECSLAAQGVAAQARVQKPSMLWSFDSVQANIGSSEGNPHTERTLLAKECACACRMKRYSKLTSHNTWCRPQLPPQPT